MPAPPIVLKTMSTGDLATGLADELLPLVLSPLAVGMALLLLFVLCLLFICCLSCCNWSGCCCCCCSCFTGSPPNCGGRSGPRGAHEYPFRLQNNSAGSCGGISVGTATSWSVPKNILKRATARPTVAAGAAGYNLSKQRDLSVFVRSTGLSGSNGSALSACV